MRPVEVDDPELLASLNRVEARELLDHAPRDKVDLVTAVEVISAPQQTWVNPYVALLDEVSRAHAHVIVLEAEVRECDAQGGAHHGRAGNRVLARYERERDRLVATCKTAISLGIAERNVRLAERQGEILSRAVIAAADRAGLDADARRALLLEVAAELRAIEAPVLEDEV